MKVIWAKLEALEEEVRQLRLLLNNYLNPPNRYETDYDIWWAKEVKPENDFTVKKVEFVPRHDPYWESKLPKRKRKHVVQSKNKKQ